MRGFIPVHYINYAFSLPFYFCHSSVFGTRTQKVFLIFVTSYPDRDSCHFLCQTANVFDSNRLLVPRKDRLGNCLKYSRFVERALEKDFRAVHLEMTDSRQGFRARRKEKARSIIDSFVRAVPKERMIPGTREATKSEFSVVRSSLRVCTHARMSSGVLYPAPIYDRANWQSLQPLGIMPINTFFDESIARMRARKRMDGGAYPVRR